MYKQEEWIKVKSSFQRSRSFHGKLVLLLYIRGHGIGTKTVCCLSREALSDFGGKDDNGDCEISRSTLEQ